MNGVIALRLDIIKHDLLCRKKYNIFAHKKGEIFKQPSCLHLIEGNKNTLQAAMTAKGIRNMSLL
jgi:hypothetical protein